MKNKIEVVRLGNISIKIYAGKSVKNGRTYLAYAVADYSSGKRVLHDQRALFRWPTTISTLENGYWKTSHPDAIPHSVPENIKILSSDIGVTRNTPPRRYRRSFAANAPRPIQMQSLLPRRHSSWWLHLRRLGLEYGIPRRWRLSRAASTVRPVRLETSWSGNLSKSFSSVVVHH